MSTHLTAAGDGSNRPAAGWSDLPDDLLGAVRSMITSPRDRARFAAVCKSWRGAASQQPATPLLLSSPCTGRGANYLCGPDDSCVFRVPTKVVGMRFLGSHGRGWVAASDNRYRVLTIINLFTGAEVPLSPKQSMISSIGHPDSPSLMDWKVVFSRDPSSSSGCILAAIRGELPSYVVLCKVGIPDGKWTEYCLPGKNISDIAFCNGELYCLVGGDYDLIKFRIGMKEDGRPEVTTTRRFANEPTNAKKYYVLNRYIIELHGKPSLAVRARWLPNREPFFKVFKLVDIDDDKVYNYKWAEVMSLDDYALFLGPKCSKEVHVPAGAEHRGLERNHIYYCITDSSREIKLPGDEVYSVGTDNGERIHMYCKEDQSIEDCVKRIGYYVSSWSDAMWLHPPDFRQ